jgi:hypothetical protein
MTPSAGVVTISGGTTGLTTSASSHTMNLTGVLNLANGGTSANLTASNGGIFYSTASAGAILAGTSTARQMLQSGATAAPAWSTATWPATTTINQILYSSAANTVGGITAGNNGVLISSASGVPSWLADGTTGQVLTATTGSPPAWANAAASSVTFTGDSGTPFSGSAVTVTGGTTGLTFAAASPNLTLGGTLVVANGGTGDASFTAYAPICGGTTTTGALQSASSGQSTSGYVLTSTGSSSLPTFQKPSSLGASFVLLQTQTASSSASLAFTTGLASYTVFMVVVSAVYPATNAASLQMLVSNNGGSSYVTSGYQCGLNYSAYNTATLTNVNSTTYVPLSAAMSNAGAAYNYSATFFYSPTGNFGEIWGTCSFWTSNNSGINCFGTLGGGPGINGINAIKFQFSSGNIAGGSISVYGLIQ